MGIDLLLFNVRTPRLRSLSDHIIENGLAILTEHLKKSHFQARVEDCGNIDFYESLSPRNITGELHLLYGKILGIDSNGAKPTKEDFGKVIKLQKELDIIQNNNMENYIDTIIEQIKIEKIPVVGMKVWYGNSYKWAKRITKKIKEEVPHTIVLHGGPHPSVYQEYFVKDTNADITIFSEGEEVLERILSKIKEGLKIDLDKNIMLNKIKKSNLKNTGYMDNSEVIKNEIVNIQLNDKTMQKHDVIDKGKLKIGVITDALGCTHNKCNFCAYGNIYKNYIVGEPNTIVDEIEYFLKKGIGLFRYSSGSSVTSHANQTANEIINRGLKINYSFFNRCEPEAKKNYKKIVSKYKTLIKSGLRAIFIGAESGNDDVLRKIMNKRIRREDLIYTVNAIRDASSEVNENLDISLSLIYPHPSLMGIDLDKSYDETLTLLEETVPDSVLPNPPAPFPGSEWFLNEKYGFDFDSEANVITWEEAQAGMAKELIDLEYVLYLPPKMWKLPKIKLNEMTMLEMFEMNAKLRDGIKKLGIETDLADEHFLILRSAGFIGKESIYEFKNKTMQSILSCNYDYIRNIYKKVNSRSEQLANESVERLTN